VGQQQDQGAEKHYDGTEGVTETDFTAGALLISVTLAALIVLVWSGK
jgi:hypothetical protein